MRNFYWLSLPKCMLSFCWALLLALGMTLPVHAQYVPWENNYTFPSQNSPMNMSSTIASDIDANGFIHIEDGHFHNAQGRINFIGLNMTHSMFHDNATAEKMAHQLQGMGINMVRIHYIDNQDMWLNFWNPSVFNMANWDKMDYFLNQLKERGIYAYLDLHAGWNYYNEDDILMSTWRSNGEIHQNGKGVDFYTDELIAQQKWYASSLLEHVNPYTQLAYKDDPMFAMIAINNENGIYRQLFRYHWNFNGLPETLKTRLRDKWKAYLTEKGITANDALPTDMSTFEDMPFFYRRHFVDFIYKLEDDYFGTMYNYLKTDLGVQVPVTGGQIDWSFPSVCDKWSDFTDNHSYWNYPQVQPGTGPQGGGWVQNDLRQKNYSMIPYEEGIYATLIPFKVKGKPYVISEIDISSPNDYSAESPIINAVMSRLQDYDAIIFYAYQMNRAWQTYTHFNFMNNFGKKALLPIASSIFCSNQVDPFPETVNYEVGVDNERVLSRERPFIPHPFASQNWGWMEWYRTDVPVAVSRNAKVEIEFVPGTSNKGPEPEDTIQQDPHFTWTSTMAPGDNYNNKSRAKKSYFRYENDFYNVFAGFKQQEEHCSFEKSSLDLVSSENDHFIYSLFNTEGKIGQPGMYILNFQGKQTWSGYTYTSTNKTGEDISNVADRYGNTLYIQVDELNSTKENMLHLPSGNFSLQLDDNVPRENISITGIDPNGDRTNDVIPFELDNGTISFELNPEHETIVYTIEVKPGIVLGNTTDQNFAPHFSISPNPAKASLQILGLNALSESSSPESISYELVDLLGKSKVSGTGTTVQVADLENGIYLLYVKVDGHALQPLKVLVE